MKWERTGVEIQGNGEKTITYRSPQLPGVRVESQRINIPHANGNGHRQATCYVAIFENDRLAGGL